MKTWAAVVVCLGTSTPGPVRSDAATAWSLTGARSWRECNEAEQHARRVLWNPSAPRLQAGDGQTWPDRARACPHAPAVLVVAARAEIGRSGWSGQPDEGGSLATLESQRRRRLEAALGWLNAGLAEANARGEVEPLEARYFRAYAHIALFRPGHAMADLRRAAQVGDAEQWRIDRVWAVAALLVGRIPVALRLAHRGVVDAPPDDRGISRYVWALVLDRAGAQQAAAFVLREARTQSGYAAARGAVMTLLPFHEGMFLRALDHQAHGEDALAGHIWAAYQAHPDPQAPERELARRHAVDLAPSQGGVGP